MCLSFPETLPFVQLLKKRKATFYLPSWNFTQNDITFPFSLFPPLSDTGLSTLSQSFVFCYSFCEATALSAYSCWPPFGCVHTCTDELASLIQTARLILISFLQTETETYRLPAPGFCSQTLIKLPSCFLQSLLPNSVVNKAMNTEGGPQLTWSHMTILWGLLKTSSNRDCTKKLYSSGTKHVANIKWKQYLKEKKPQHLARVVVVRTRMMRGHSSKGCIVTNMHIKVFSMSAQQRYSNSAHNEVSLTCAKYHLLPKMRKTDDRRLQIMRKFKPCGRKMKLCPQFWRTFGSFWY